MVLIAALNLIKLFYPIIMTPMFIDYEPMIADETVEIESETYIITAYTAGPESTGKSPGHPDYGKTSSGEYVQEGITIACPPSMDFYTVVEIEGLGERVCHDRGSAIQGNKIDIYMPYVKDALAFGVQEREVRIVSE